MKVTPFNLTITSLLVLFVLALIAGQFFGIRWNKTSSIPTGLYQISDIPEKGLKRNELVIACPEDTQMQRQALDRGYLLYGFACDGGFAPIFKKVMAFPGDKIQISDEKISINGVSIKNSKRHLFDANGRVLPVKSSSNVVPEGFVWLLSDYTDKSWDSRYFGPVPIKSIFGVAKPIWLFE